MFKKEIIIEALEKADLSDIEIIKEEEGMALVRFYYDFDEDELAAAQSFADSEESEADSEEDDEFEVIDDEDELAIDEIQELVEEEEAAPEDEEAVEEDLGYDEEDEYYDIPKLRYLSEIAIDQVGESLEEIRDDLDIEIQYVGYDLDEEDYGSYEFVALLFDKDKVLNIEDILDELDM